MSNVSIAGYVGWPACDTFLIVLLSGRPVYDPNPLRPNPNPKKPVLGSCRVRGLGRTLTPLVFSELLQAFNSPIFLHSLHVFTSSFFFFSFYLLCVCFSKKKKNEKSLFITYIYIYIYIFSEEIIHYSLHFIPSSSAWFTLKYVYI